MHDTVIDHVLDFADVPEMRTVAPAVALYMGGREDREVSVTVSLNMERTKVRIRSVTPGGIRIRSRKWGREDARHLRDKIAAHRLNGGRLEDLEIDLGGSTPGTEWATRLPVTAELEAWLIAALGDAPAS